ncbi:MAG: uracil-DNA glycosylase family protein [Kofleriaceae bacterium]
MFNAEATACAECVEHGLLHEDDRGRARPLLTRTPTGRLGIVLVGEAPNADDTFAPHKGYLTYDSETDPTGRFVRDLLVNEAGLTHDEMADVLFTNAVLCLPRRNGNRFPVTATHMRRCTRWLRRLIDDSEATVVLAMGATALRAVGLIEPHHLKLKRGAGKLHDWYGRKLLPLYHAGRLGRISRPEASQRDDMRALRRHLGRVA